MASKISGLLQELHDQPIIDELLKASNEVEKGREEAKKCSSTKVPDLDLYKELLAKAEETISKQDEVD